MRERCAVKFLSLTITVKASLSTSSNRCKGCRASPSNTLCSANLPQLGSPPSKMLTAFTNLFWIAWTKGTMRTLWSVSLTSLRLRKMPEFNLKMGSITTLQTLSPRCLRGWITTSRTCCSKLRWFKTSQIRIRLSTLFICFPLCPKFLSFCTTETMSRKQFSQWSWKVPAKTCLCSTKWTKTFLELILTISSLVWWSTVFSSMG